MTKPKKPSITPVPAKDNTPAPGRPVGSKNVTEVITVKPSRCAKCGSTERTPYTNTLEREIAGIHEGQEYTHILWRSTTCVGCSQARRDRYFENRPKPASESTLGESALPPSPRKKSPAKK